MTESVSSPNRSPGPPLEASAPKGHVAVMRVLLYAVPSLVAAGLVRTTIRHHELNEVYFVASAYYIAFAMLASYLWVLVPKRCESASLCRWVSDNRFGITVTAVVSLVVLWSIAPAYRVLADEANLVGVSKNLYFQRTANFATTGKWYFENYWNINLATDRRPVIFPFFVSLLHIVRGYQPSNAFHFNAIVFVLFVYASYGLAKTIGGELFGVASAILVATNPNTLVAARSAGFDLLATFMLLLVIRSFMDYVHDSTPRRLAILVLHLCLLAQVRYEGWGLLLASAVVLLAFRMVRLRHLAGYGILYAILPIFLLPRYWQSIAKANDGEQPLSASLFSIPQFLQNGRDYLRVVLHPFDVGNPHSPILIMLAVGGLWLALRWLFSSLRRRELTKDRVKCLVLVAVLVGLEVVISFSYVWGKPLHPSSARLFVWLDTAVGFGAAFFITELAAGAASRARSMDSDAAPVRPRAGMAAVLACSILFVLHVPAAVEARFVNSQILTRQATQTWAFFEKLGTKNILIMGDRPGLYTIMDYGALDIAIGESDNRGPLLELSRRLYRDIYLVQEISLDTHQPLPGFNAWPDVPKETVFEFQNTDSTSVRIARINR